jgi:diaminopimelate epimerase
MEKISFIKMSGAGNDFIVINKDLFPELILNSSSIKKLCDRRNGVGADGLITITGSDVPFDFIMRYYNSDGTTGSLCGNGVRCAIRFAVFSKITENKFVRFLSNDKEYSGNIIAEEKTKVNFNVPAKIILNNTIKVADQLVKSSFIDTGSPHIIINIEDVLKDPADKSSNYSDLNTFPVFNLGKEIRYDFSPEGTNVNFIKIIGNKVYIRTYERGVEDETLSCGTGATASALAAHFLYNMNSPVSIVTKGGDILTVNFSTKGRIITDLSLTGPVKIVFTGEFLYSAFF